MSFFKDTSPIEGTKEHDFPDSNEKPHTPPNIENGDNVLSRLQDIIDSRKKDGGIVPIEKDDNVLSGLQDIINSRMNDGGIVPNLNMVQDGDLTNSSEEKNYPNSIKIDDNGQIYDKENNEIEEAAKIREKLNSVTLDAYVTDVPDALCDDNGKQYRTEDGELIPNNTYVLDGVDYKTDDNGNIYSIDGKLKPNTTYELNGNIYTTDEKGRIISCDAKPKSSPENPRDNEAQRQAGGEDRHPNDQGGHIVGRDMNGDGGIGNLVAMDSRINQSDYKRMENDIKAALDEGKDVTTRTEFTYHGDSERPAIITETVTVDGKDTVYKFDNNLDGSLRDEVPENGKETVQDRLEETGGEISSIKEEYDEDGNLVETTVYITYKGEDGSNYRTSVVIENQ